MADKTLIEGDDGKMRCPWPGSDPFYRRYHDEEWGRPVTDDIRLFEKICLEGFQSGLSWITILRKRENFRAAFDGFDFRKVALYGEADVERLVQDAGIVRHRGKIVSTVNNAKRAIELVDEAGSLAAFFWSFEPGAHERPDTFSWEVLSRLGKTEISTTISRQLKKRGWTFVGPTTVYAFMQAMGLVNDHIEGCVCRAEVETMRARLNRPTR
ncbi:MAG: DNA-3-methyladenine glycosylase I [Rhizobiaceae bacterium]|nr:DNA-3-methyladenine glycosylase I [Rhizobiaceae bacterium]